MPDSSATAPRPLDGVRVLDIATMLAGPFCATILGEFGAEVIKVEMPGGEGIRNSGTMVDEGRSLMWLSEARNKKSVTLDMRKPEGVALFKRLVAATDIVVENFRPGTLERWGIGYDVLKEVKPDIILVRVSAYGQTGPNRGRPGFARIAHAFAGLSFLAGEADGPPVVPGSTSMADYITGLYSALGAMMAYTARQRYGIGQYVDSALYEGILRMLDDMIPTYDKTGYVRERMGADTVNHVPHSHYETKDGRWVALACTNDRMFERLARAMERPDLLASDAFATMRQRIARRAEINGIVADYIRKVTRDELMEHFLAHEVPVGPINSVADIFADPHIIERGNLVRFDATGTESVVIPGVVPRLSETPGRIETLGPKLAEHNAEVYGGRLGLSADEMSRLAEAGVI
jgi:crotonobetainyl-CoA:carnitine CoA-transferase CaiB-like acyl-CoA transferase